MQKFRLVGTGKSTVGIDRVLLDGEVIVIGRHDECTVALTNVPEASLVSRQHLVVEQRQDGEWFVYDAGSTNGTILYSGGIAPGVSLQPGIGERLQPNDSFELAGEAALSFAFVRERLSE